MNKRDSYSFAGLLVLLIVIYAVSLLAALLIFKNIMDSNSWTLAFAVFAVILTITFIVLLGYLLLVTRYKKNIGTLKRTLISNVNHELKTPITSIKAMAEALYDGLEKDPEKQHEYLGIIISETDRMEQLVLDMQALQKLQSQHIVFEKHKSTIDEILPPLIDRYKMLCMDLKLNFNIDIDLDRIPKLFTAPDKMITVFDILLNNATKYTPEGGTITLSCEIKEKKIVFCVSDNGIGIAREDQDRIFERFYRADKSRHTTGSGLGLAIAYNTLKGLHEDIWVKSEQGLGSSFYFTVNRI